MYDDWIVGLTINVKHMSLIYSLSPQKTVLNSLPECCLLFCEVTCFRGCAHHGPHTKGVLGHIHYLVKYIVFWVVPLLK